MFILALGACMAMSFSSSKKHENVDPVSDFKYTGDLKTDIASIPVGTEFKLVYSDGTERTLVLTQERKDWSMLKTVEERAKFGGNQCAWLYCSNNIMYCCTSTGVPGGNYCYPVGASFCPEP
jgi:hypothetical protein